MSDPNIEAREERPLNAGASRDPEAAGEPEPNTAGTLFIMIVFLMLLAGMWVMVYWILLER